MQFPLLKICMRTNFLRESQVAFVACNHRPWWTHAGRLMLNVAGTSGDGHLQPDDASDITPTDTRKENCKIPVSTNGSFRRSDSSYSSLIHSHGFMPFKMRLEKTFFCTITMTEKSQRSIHSVGTNKSTIWNLSTCKVSMIGSQQMSTSNQAETQELDEKDQLSTFKVFEHHCHSEISRESQRSVSLLFVNIKFI